jgi:hypothetical protein
MPVEQWVALDKAEYAVAILQNTRHFAGDQPPTEDARIVIEGARKLLDAGQAALEELAMR